jgi:hypothetical protein
MSVAEVHVREPIVAVAIVPLDTGDGVVVVRKADDVLDAESAKFLSEGAEELGAVVAENAPGHAERTQNEIGECSDRVGCVAARDDLGHHEAGEALDDRDRESAAEFVADVKRVDLPFGQSDRDAVAFDVAEVAMRARAWRVDALAHCAAADRVLDLRVHSGPPE